MQLYAIWGLFRDGLIPDHDDAFVYAIVIGICLNTFHLLGYPSVCFVLQVIRVYLAAGRHWGAHA